MIYVEKDGLKLSKEKVKFLKKGIQEGNYIGPEGIGWWEELENKHDYIEIVEIIELSQSEEILKRYEEVKNITTSFDEIRDYIENGDVSVLIDLDDKNIENFLLKKENKVLKEELEITNQAVDFVLMNGGV